MKSYLNKINNKRKAFTLLETVLAMSVGALLLAALLGTIFTCLRTWSAYEKENEAILQANLAMQRMVTDLRYTKNLINYDRASPLSYFFVINTRGADFIGDALIEYEVNALRDTVTRSVSDTFGGGLPVVNTIYFSEDYEIHMFFVPLKPQADPTILTDLTLADSFSDAIALRIYLVVQFGGGKEYRSETTVKFRNRISPLFSP